MSYRARCEGRMRRRRRGLARIMDRLDRDDRRADGFVHHLQRLMAKELIGANRSFARSINVFMYQDGT